MNKYNEEQGLIEQIIFEGKPTDFVNKISAEVVEMDYENSLINFTVHNDNGLDKKYKAKLFIDENYYLDDIIIEEIKE